MSYRKDIFAVLLLIGRPASGKSEIIDYLKRLEPAERRRRFHIGKMRVIDDFPMLWSWFEEDRILSNLGKPMLHTKEGGYFKEPYLWDLLVRRLCLEYEKLKAADPTLHDHSTTIIELSRGSEHGGYRRACQHLSAEVARQAALLYVRVSLAESLRKNRLRYNPERPHSILEHSLPDEKMKKLYEEDDWPDLSSSGSDFLDLQGRRVPYRVFENEDDVTTIGEQPLGRRLESCLGSLWQLYSQA